MMKKKQPLLSICIPTYNRKKQLEETLKCLVAQIPNLSVEIIISDNASEDGTKELCEYYVGRYNVSYFRQKVNRGFASNLIHVLSKGKGEYLWMLGDDEILRPNAVALVCKAIVEKKPAWLITNFIKSKKCKVDWDSAASYFDISDKKELLPLNSVLNITGVWASFMSINIVKKGMFDLWLDNEKDYKSDYICFNIALFSGKNGGCYLMPESIIARESAPLNKHRFNKLSVYLYDFFIPLDRLVRKGIVTKKIRNKLAKEMFLSMSLFLLLRHKLLGNLKISIGELIKCHYKVIYLWIVFLPIIVLPRWAIFLILRLSSIVPSSKLKRLVDNLDGDMK